MKIIDPLPWHEPVSGDRLATTLAAGGEDLSCFVRRCRRRDCLMGDAHLVRERFHHVAASGHHFADQRLRQNDALAFAESHCAAGKAGRKHFAVGVVSSRRTISADNLLDETEKYIEHGSDLHALLNEGHCKGGSCCVCLEKNWNCANF